SLISMEQRKIRAHLHGRRMPLCQGQPPAGAPVIIAALRGITRTSIAPPTVIAPEYRTKYSTLISDGSTDGKSGSGVFDAEGKCLLGILSQKFTNDIDHKGIASYFVPASTIHPSSLSGFAGDTSLGGLESNALKWSAEFMKMKSPGPWRTGALRTDGPRGAGTFRPDVSFSLTARTYSGRSRSPGRKQLLDQTGYENTRPFDQITRTAKR